MHWHIHAYLLHMQCMFVAHICIFHEFGLKHSFGYLIMIQLQCYILESCTTRSLPTSWCTTSCIHLPETPSPGFESHHAPMQLHQASRLAVRSVGLGHGFCGGLGAFQDGCNGWNKICKHKKSRKTLRSVKHKVPQVVEPLFHCHLRSALKDTGAITAISMS